MELRGRYDNSVKSLFKLGFGDGSQGRQQVADDANTFRRGATKMLVQAAEVTLESGGMWGFGRQGEVMEKVQVCGRSGDMGYVEFGTVVVVYGGGPLEIPIW